MMETEALLDRLAGLYQQGFATVQIAAERAAQDAWYSLDSFDSATDEEWEAAFWTVVLGAVTVSSGLALSYIGRQFAAEGIDIDLPELDLSWVEDDFDVWRKSPMAAARIGVSRGLDPVDALRAGATRVTDLTTAIVREAEQRTIDDFLASIGEIEVEVDYTEIDSPVTPPTKAGGKTLWKRVTSPGVCGWCRVASDRLYSGRAKKKHPLGSWHTYCRCTWRKITAQEAAQWEQNLAGGEWRTVIKERFDPVAAGQTGE